MSTLAEKETIWRLRNLHEIKNPSIYDLFPHIPKSTIRRIVSTWTPPPPNTTPAEIPPPANKQTVEYRDGSITAEAVTPINKRIITLDDLIKTTEIDLDCWTIDRWIANAWENVMKGPDGTPIHSTLHQVKAYLKPNQLAAAKALLEALREELREGIPPYKPTTQTRHNKGQYLLEISIPDMHLGKLALEEETGQAWDLDIAEQIYRTTVKALLASAQENDIAQILLPLGNDLIHIDNAYGKTFAGTDQDAIHSIKHLFRRVKNILRDAIEDMTAIAPVKVISVPGNHDTTVNYFLVDALEDSFYRQPAVTFDNSPLERKYTRWGKVLLGFTHGDQEKHTDLPTLMADEAPEDWAKATWREWHIGHLHRKRVLHYMPTTTNKGVIIRILPSLTAADKWHYRKGFTGGARSAEAYLWSKTDGLVATYNSNLS